MVRQDTLCTLRDGNSGIKAFSDLPDGTFQKNHCRLGNDYGKRLLHNTDFCSVIINKERYGHRESETEPGRGSGGKRSERTVFCLPKFTIPDGKQLVVEMNEKDGGRHQTFTVENEDLVQAETINELRVR